MGIYQFINVILLTCVFFAGNLEKAEACSCMRAHPQQQYCRADFVILARIKRDRIFNQTRVYKVRVKKEFKVSEKGLSALKSGRLLTPSFDSMCGVDLEVGKLYVLTGRIYSLKAYVNLCDMVIEWNELSRRQRKGLKLLYRFGCSCDIRQCSFGRRCSRVKDSCNWRNDCETKEGICMRQPNNSCMWTRTKALTQCTRQWRKHTAKNTTSTSYNKALVYY